MKIFVTGGAGFIGSHTTEELIRHGHEVTVLDNFSTGRRDNLKAVKKRLNLIKGDINDTRLLKKCVRHMDAVMHLAAISSVQQSLLQPDRTHHANVTGALNVFQAAADQGIKKVVYASSCAVYGNNPKLPKREDMPMEPVSFYAESKRANESYARLFHHSHNMTMTGMRYFNVFGERQAPGSPYSGVISIFMKQFRSRRRPLIFGDGKQTRDFVYVRDIARANRLALESQAAACNVWNVGSGGSISLNQLLDMMNQVYGSRLKAHYRPARMGEVRHSLADIRNIREALGFSPEFSFASALRQTAKLLE